jgi:hypothetical protein
MHFFLITANPDDECSSEFPLAYLIILKFFVFWLKICQKKAKKREVIMLILWNQNAFSPLHHIFYVFPTHFKSNTQLISQFHHRTYSRIPPSSTDYFFNIFGLFQSHLSVGKALFESGCVSFFPPFLGDILAGK